MRSILPICLIVNILLVSCGESHYVSIRSSKLNAEETGYENEFGSLYFKLSNYTYEYLLSSKNCELAREVKNQDEIDKNEKEKNRKLESIVSLKNEYGNLLDLTLPPKEFTDIHNQTLNLFKNIYNSSQTIKYSSCIEFYKTISILDKKLENRKELHKIADKITLTYQPPIIPLSINSEKDLNFNISFKSPIGNFSLARSSDEGIKKLIIISQNKRRYFSLDRPFEFYIPKNNGVSVSLQDEVLTINVFDK